MRPAGMDMFQRARRVACRKAGRALSGGMALEILSEHYVDSFDPLSRKPGERRVGDTTYVRGRYVPMEVKREVYARQNGRCAVPFCEHVLFLEYAHVVWHASGGSREAENILLFCTPHHHAFDAREFRLVGTAAAPRFLDRLGRPLDERRGNEYEPPYVAALLHRPRGRLLPRTLGEELDILEGFEPGLDVPLDAFGDVRVKRRPPRP